MSYVNEDELKKIFETQNITFLVNLEIPYHLGSKESHIKGYNMLEMKFVAFLRQQIQLYPLFGGGLDPNKNYNIVVGFKNGNDLKAIWDNESYPGKLKIIEDIKIEDKEIDAKNGNSSL